MYDTIGAIFLLLAVGGIFFSGYAVRDDIEYSREDCTTEVKEQYDIIDFDKSELDAKIKACEVLFHE